MQHYFCALKFNCIWGKTSAMTLRTNVQNKVMAHAADQSEVRQFHQTGL